MAAVPLFDHVLRAYLRREHERHVIAGPLGVGIASLYPCAPAPVVVCQRHFALSANELRLWYVDTLRPRHWVRVTCFARYKPLLLVAFCPIFVNARAVNRGV